MMLATLLLGLGVADLVAAPGGGRVSRRGAWIGALAAAGAALVLLVERGLPWWSTALVVLVVGLLAACWTLVRAQVGRPTAMRRPLVALAALGSVVAAVAVVDSQLLAGGESQLSATWWLVTLSVLQVGTGNAVVRLILHGLEDPTHPSRPLDPDGSAAAQRRSVGGRRSIEDELRGGRFIGPLERLIVFGLAVAGQVTAAVVVASVKSLLRFPELSQARASEDQGTTPGSPGPRRIDYLTEYLVVGSLSSWLLALASAGAYHWLVTS